MNRKLMGLSLCLAAGILLFLAWDLERATAAYALSRRLPKVAALLLTGSAIAFSSLLFQTVTDNRILTPSVLGLESLYQFLQTALMFVFGSRSLGALDQRLSFLLAVGLMILFSTGILGTLLKRLNGNIYLLLLVGIVTGTLFRSGASFLQVILDPNEFLILQGNLFASFNNINRQILWPAGLMMAAVMLIMVRRHRELNVLALGRDQAISLGVGAAALTRLSLFCVAVLVSVATALVGPITFLGVLVTNLAREFLGTHRHLPLFLGSMLFASLALVYGQFLVEQVFSFNTPISVLINFVGGLYFILLLLKERPI